MSFSWTNFENNAETSSIRETLNQLGVNIAEIIKVYQNVDVSSLSFVDDATYSSYGFTKRLDIPFNDITIDDIPIVIFLAKDALSGDYGGVATEDGFVHIWCRDSIESQLATIPFIGVIKTA